MNGLKLAEREGFEPSVQVAPDNCLAGSPVRPLQHLSAVESSPFYGAVRGFARVGGTYKVVAWTPSIRAPES